MSARTVYLPGVGRSTCSETWPFGSTGGWRWMIAESPSETMIMWTPVWGPGAVLYAVSGWPEGSWTVKPTVAGLPGATALAGDLSTSFHWLAGPTVIVGVEEPPPQPASRATTGRISRAR